MLVKRFTLIIILVLLLLSSSFAQAQDTLDMLDALALVRDTYGEDVGFLGGSYNDSLVCWEFELEDGNKVCVSDTTGEFVDIGAAQAAFPTKGVILFSSLFAVAILAFFWLRQSITPQINQEASKASFSFHLRLPYSVNSMTLRLSGIAFYLAIQSIAARWFQEQFVDAPHVVNRFVRFVNINLEKSLPTWYSSLLLLLAAVLLGLIARSKTTVSYRKYWHGLSYIFVYLSIDEATALHEELTRPLREMLGTSGFLHFAWVIVGAIFVGVVALAYIRFVFHLPTPICNLVIVGGGVFIAGALVIESYSASLYAISGTTLPYSAIGTVEEFCEMFGVIIFIRALLLYWQTHIDNGQEA